MRNQLYQVLSKNTMRSYEQAAKWFEMATGKSIQEADEKSLAIFQSWMQEYGLKVNTIRTRLSAVAVVTGVKVELPKREKPKERDTLTAEQVRVLMSAVTTKADRMFLMQLLMLGPQARTITVTSPICKPPFVDMTETTLNAQQASRKIKHYARLAGLDEKQISLRVWCQTGQRLISYLGPLELADLVGLNTDPSKGIGWKPLHGIGRRIRRK